MRKFAAFLLCFLFLSSAAWAEPVSFGAVSFDSEAESIDLGDQVVTDYNRFIDFLRQFPNLKHVDMFATLIPEDKVQKLEKAFPDVSFGWYLKMMRYHFIRSDAEAYSTLHGQHPNHPSREFALLKYCTQLKALDLGHNNLTNVEFLRSMPHLRVLIFAENPNLKNVEEIGRLAELEYLELFTCGITDISPLVNCTSLLDLNLGNNKVRDWRPLKQMTWLRRLWIPGMCAKKMTAEDLAELQEALPDTQIMADGKYKNNPVGNGWRTDPETKENHPHYDVIYQIFHTDTYIPFAESAPLPGEAPADPADVPDGAAETPVTLVEEIGNAEDLFGGADAPQPE